MNKFAVFKNLIRANEVLQFPEFLLISRNHFHLEWMIRRTMRRLKNVVVVMEWSPADLQQRAISNGVPGEPVAFSIYVFIFKRF
jgi:hypothetical protein